MMIKPITEYRVKRKYSMDNRSKSLEHAETYKGPCIYAIRDEATGCVKVGRTINLPNRSREVRNLGSHERRLMGAFFIADQSRLADLEKAVLKKLRSIADNTRGEWFYVKEGVLRSAVIGCSEALGVSSLRVIGIFNDHDGKPAVGRNIPDFSEHKTCRSDGRARNKPCRVL